MAAYEVWIKGFAPKLADPVPELMRVFSIGEERARKLADSIPVAVKKNATHEVAEKFSRGLEKIGAVVEIRAAGGGETSGTWSERPPSRSARSVAPSRKRTGRGLGRIPSSPQMPVFDAMPADGLPRRRTASGQMEMVLDAPPERRSSPAMEALDAAPPAPRRRSHRTMPATSAVVAAVLAPESEFVEDEPVAAPSLPRRQKATAFLGSATAVEELTEPIRRRSAAPDAAKAPLRASAPVAQPIGVPAPSKTSDPIGDLELAPPSPVDLPGVVAVPGPDVPPPPTRSGTPRSGRAAPLSRPPRPALDSLEPPPSGVPRSGIPAPLSAPPPPVQETPFADADPWPQDEPKARSSQRRDSLAAIGVAVAGVLIIAWRLQLGSSIFQGQASWIFGVWLEASALAMIAAGIMTWMAARDGRRDEAFAGQGRLALALVFPVAFLANWAVASTNDSPELTAGSVDERIKTLNTIADACERTAKDASSCATCCQSKMDFDTVCECRVPWRCRDGDESAEACGKCCRSEAKAGVTHTLVRGQGCVCDGDDSLYE